MMTPFARPSLGRRLLAIVYDSLIVLAIVLLTALAVELVSVALSWSTSPSDGLQAPKYGSWYLALIYWVVGLYFGYFWRQSGQTVGMKAWRLRLQASGGFRPSWVQCLLRYLMATLSLATLGLGYLWMYSNKERRTWPDLFSNTELELLPKAGKRNS